MTDRLHLPARYREHLEALLREHLPDVEVWAYGSRVDGRSHDGSDLDLVLRGPGLEEIDLARLDDFQRALHDSTMPFLVEARDWARLPVRFHREIEREYVVLLRAAEAESWSGSNHAGWCELRLGDVCTRIGSGATPRGGSKVYLDCGPFAFIRSQNVYNDGFRPSGLAFLDDRRGHELDSVEVEANDVFLNITGDSVARSCQVDPSVLPARVNQHVAIVRPDPQVLDPGFLRYALVSPELQALMLSWARSGGTRNALTKGMIESLPVWAPADPEEQRAIAHILGTLDDKIELNRQMSRTLESMARALFKSWFVDFDPVRAKMEGRDTGLPRQVADLFPNRLVNSELGEIPKGWLAGTLADVADLNPESWGRRNTPEKVRYVDLSNTKWGVIESVKQYPWESAPSRARRVLRPGDTIVGTVRPGNGSFALVERRGLTGSTGFAVLRPKSPIERETVYCAATSPGNVDRLARLADGGAYPAVNPTTILSTVLVLPGPCVRVAFSSLVAPLLSQAQENRREDRSLGAARDALLPRLVSGEIRLREAMVEEVGA